MTQAISRRGALRLGLIGGLLALPTAALGAAEAVIPAGPSPMYPDHFLKVLGFFGESDPSWYETVHAPDFMGFARPYMARYSRNWIKEVESGPTPWFQVITEINYKDEAAKQEVRRLNNSPASAALMEHTMARRAARMKLAPAPGEPAAQPPRRNLFSAVPHTQLARTSAGTADSVRRKVLLLARTPETSPRGFEAAATAMAREIARSGAGIGVSLDVLEAAPGAPADAIIYIDGLGAAALPSARGKAFTLVNVLNVETRNSIK